MNIEAEKEYQKRALELTYAVEATAKAKFEEYAAPPHPRTDPLHHFLASIHRLKPRRIYEIGAGAGELTTRLAKCGYEISAVELSPDLIAAAQQRAKLDGVENRIKFVEGDALAHREPGEKFDLVIAKLILHHVDLDAALDAICDHVSPEGTVLIYEPVAFSPLLQWIRDHSGVPKDISPNERQLNRRDLELIGARFERIDVSYFLLLARFARLMPAGGIRHFARRLLSCIDAILLPALKNFSGSVVIEAHGVRAP
jgi:2-polyprenyl-3-methyl-5-hydroxy-6-metoxy-1,4-benzoquinol methylase